jgi:hypothetical protein
MLVHHQGCMRPFTTPTTPTATPATRTWSSVSMWLKMGRVLGSVARHLLTRFTKGGGAAEGKVGNRVLGWYSPPILIQGGWQLKPCAQEQASKVQSGLRRSQPCSQQQQQDLGSHEPQLC